MRYLSPLASLLIIFSTISLLNLSMKDLRTSMPREDSQIITELIGSCLEKGFSPNNIREILEKHAVNGSLIELEISYNGSTWKYVNPGIGGLRYLREIRVPFFLNGSTGVVICRVAQRG